MRLCDAIRKGAAQRPQAFARFALFDAGALVGTCALGAAAEGLLGADALRELDRDVQSDAQAMSELHRAFPALLEFISAPFLPDGVIMLESAIILANDEINMSREEIADWVEEIEERLQ